MAAPKRISLGYEPRPWQRACNQQRKRFTVLALHRRAGKTVWALMLLIDAALRSDKPAPLFVYVAPYLSQAKAIAWLELKRRVDPLVRAGIAQIREVDLLVEFASGARIRLYGADNPDALRGVRLDGVVLDEVAQIKPQVWTDILQPALSDRLGWAAFIGTPNGINLFSELFFNASGRPDWLAKAWSVYETDALDAAEVERLRDSMPETSFAREYLCDFAASGQDQLISLTDARGAAGRGRTMADVHGMPVVLGVDPARFGDDRSVIVRRQGLLMYEPVVFRGIDNMALADAVAALIEQHRPDGVFVDHGGGAGVVDRLKQLGHTVSEVAFGGRSTQERIYINRRTEMWCRMAEWLRSGSVPNDPTLLSELCTPTYSFDHQGRKVLESKDDIKKRLQGGASPDIADALALTFASPVAAKSQWTLLGLPDPTSGRVHRNPFDLGQRGRRR